MKDDDFLLHVQAKAAQRILYLPHAIHRMSEVQPAITTADVRDALFRGQMIENYPEDVRGHSCLILGWRGEGDPIHVVCSPKDEYLAIITAYAPEENRWYNGFSRRKPV